MNLLVIKNFRKFRYSGFTLTYSTYNPQTKDERSFTL